jgi:ketosteroid isomerase-like protein
MLAMDARDADRFTALWTEDAVFTVNDDVGLETPLHGPQAIAGAILAWLARLDDGGVDWVRHVCGTPLIEVEDGVVVSAAPFVSVHHDLTGAGRPVISRTGVYSDRIVKVGGRWRIAARHLAWDAVRNPR